MFWLAYEIRSILVSGPRGRLSGRRNQFFLRSCGRPWRIGVSNCRPGRGRRRARHRIGTHPCGRSPREPTVLVEAWGHRNAVGLHARLAVPTLAAVGDDSIVSTPGKSRAGSAVWVSRPMPRTRWRPPTQRSSCSSRRPRSARCSARRSSYPPPSRGCRDSVSEIWSSPVRSS